MKLVVLGNGFDLANNLPTKYKNFFDYYNDKYSIEFDYIYGLLHKEKKSKITDSLSGVIPNETYSRIEDELRKGIKKDFNITNTIVKNPYISIWNLYFWHAKENLKMNNWSDVEGQIAEVINDFSSLTLLGSEKCINNISDLIDNFYNYNIEKTKNKISSYDIIYKEDIYISFSLEDRFRFICDSIVLKRYRKPKSNEDIYYLDVLKKELEIFEEGFRQYISKISKEIIDKNKRTYRSHLLEIADDFTSKKLYLLNFNYTEFSNAGATKIDTVTMSYNKVNIDIKQINVHGTHQSKIIFGIDQTDQNEKSFYQFTKTYRKMEYSDDIPTIQLPEPKYISEIVFYGHSLSNPDYSYFHSLFDYYNIYGSEIKLCFKYSLHKDKSNCKHNNIQKIMELLKTYGEKMFDRARGENLVHKLLLENRLSICEVILEPLNLIKFI